MSMVGFQIFFTSPQRHREHRANFFLPDRETTIGQKNAALRAVLLKSAAISAVDCVSSKEIPPKAEALSPGRRLPARGRYTLSVSSVSPWLIP